LDFTNASHEDLKQLAAGCDPATFGKDQEDVLDETYRRAGKLDETHFSIRFDPGHAGIMAAVQNVLLEGHDMKKTTIRYELYKLNVYGPGQFFKAHKDTPRGEKMFASLVVVLPTTHEGGALVFRHQERSFTFDSAAALAGASGSSVAFAAFYSDIEHEVTPVTSGYRVTLTYNLFYEDVAPSPSISELLSSPKDSAIRDALTALMEDQSYLPNGGFIGFGLRHEYALSTESAAQDVKPFLKGSDAVLSKVSEALGLQTTMWVVYRDDDE
ncbi:hypothetical protein BC835DRAFT_1246955, partial [Cytidiella melzeri]